MGPGSVEDDMSYEWFFMMGQGSNGNRTEYWIADNAGLGIIENMVTSDGDDFVFNT